jgi:hypothetical protein
MNSAEEEREESMKSTPHGSGLDENIFAGGLGSAMAARHRRMPPNPEQQRIGELERENSRLQKLVAELLLKNQQLRKLE